ncbi:MAG: deoxyribose-phosphate aldolase [Aquificae bacterium]|nr:deoxyribose-phosphate aldolase [Aquificota bacterium]
MHSSLPINRYIDHSNLKPYATYEDIEILCKEALQYNFYAVCVNPFYVRQAKNNLKNSTVKVCSVIGFPLGANSPKTKLVEASTAVNDGADELDIVWNIGAFKSGYYDFVENELKTIISYTQNVVHKVIVETAYLTEEEKKTALNIVINAGAEFIKTSTGFAPSGAKVEDIKMWKKLADGKIKIKAAGGIRDYHTAIMMIQAGADRIGTSHGVQIVKRL